MKQNQTGFSMVVIIVACLAAGLLLFIFIAIKPKPESLARQYAKKIATPSYMNREDINTDNCPLGKCPQKEIELEYPDTISDSKAWSDMHQSLVAAGYSKSEEDGDSELKYYTYTGDSAKNTCDTLYISHQGSSFNQIEINCRFNASDGSAIYKNPKNRDF